MLLEQQRIDILPEIFQRRGIEPDSNCPIDEAGDEKARYEKIDLPMFIRFRIPHNITTFQQLSGIQIHNNNRSIYEIFSIM